MTQEEYLEAIAPFAGLPAAEIEYLWIGLVGEVGELIQALDQFELARVWHGGRCPDAVTETFVYAILKEAGDVYFYLSMLALKYQAPFATPYSSGQLVDLLEQPAVEHDVPRAKSYAKSLLQDIAARCNTYKKVMRGDAPINAEEVCIQELLDTLITILYSLDISLQEVRIANALKLAGRAIRGTLQGNGDDR